MIRLPGEGLGHRARPSRRVLARQAVNEVQAHVGEPGRPRRRERSPGIGRGVQAVEGRQHAVVQALDAQADPRHPGRAIAREALGGHALGIALHGDLRIRRDAETRPQRRENAGEVVGGKKGRRAAAEENGAEMDGGGPRRRPRQGDLGVEGAQEAGHRRRQIGSGVERAVAAALGAERHVHVGAEPGRSRRPRVERRYGSQLPSRLHRSQCRSPFHDQ